MWKATAAGTLLGLLLRSWRHSLRFRVTGGEWLDELPRYVLASWHGRLMGPLLCVGDRGVLTMASHSADGELAARAVAQVGLTAVRGSTGKGGGRALAEMERWLREGRGAVAGLTVDGPRGPRGWPKRGAVELARSLDIPILPTSFSSRPCRLLRSWDHMLVAPPFARVQVRFGPPLTVDPEEPLRHAQLRLQAALDAMTVELDSALHGRSLWQPAAPPEAEPGL